MARVYFSSNKNHPLSESHYKFGYVIDLLNLGYTIDHSGIDLGNIEAKTSYIDIEGADGQIDVTNALTDDVHYKNRHIRVHVQSVSMYSTDRLPDRFALDQIFSGKYMKMFVEDFDADWYMEGRFSLESSFSVPIRKYTIIGDCKPYRYNVDESEETFTVTDTLECAIDYADSMPVCPTINVSSDMELTLNGAVYSLKQGDNIVPDMILRNGTNTFSLTGTGTSKFTWRGGNL